MSPVRAHRPRTAGSGSRKVGLAPFLWCMEDVVFARFHFLTARQTQGPWTAAPRCADSLGEDHPGPRLALWLECETNGDFARGNYGSHSFTYVRITFCPHRTPSARPYVDTNVGPNDILCDGRLLMHARGEVTPRVGSNDFYLITTCKITEHDAPNFLTQFVTAREYIRHQPGFIRHHLFENHHPDAAFRFINVAAWQSMKDFVTAFSSPEFKKLIKGGFDYSSQIIVARRATALGSIF